MEQCRGQPRKQVRSGRKLPDITSASPVSNVNLQTEEQFAPKEWTPVPRFKNSSSAKFVQALLVSHTILQAIGHSIFASVPPFKLTHSIKKIASSSGVPDTPKSMPTRSDLFNGDFLAESKSPVFQSLLSVERTEASSTHKIGAVIDRDLAPLQDNLEIASSETVLMDIKMAEVESDSLWALKMVQAPEMNYRKAEILEENKVMFSRTSDPGVHAVFDRVFAPLNPDEFTGKIQTRKFLVDYAQPESRREFSTIPFPEQTDWEGHDITDGGSHGLSVSALISGKGIAVAPGTPLMVYAQNNVKGIFKALKQICREIRNPDSLRIINMSLSDTTFRDQGEYFRKSHWMIRDEVRHKAALDELLSMGCVVSKSAGNEGYRGEHQHHPSYFRIESVDSKGNIAESSSVGKYRAPGQGVLTRSWSGFEFCGDEVPSLNSGCKSLEGTSIATPVVTGIGANVIDVLDSAPYFARLSSVQRGLLLDGILFYSHIDGVINGLRAVNIAQGWNLLSNEKGSPLAPSEINSIRVSSELHHNWERFLACRLQARREKLLANKDKVDFDGRTLLHSVAQRGDLEATKILVIGGADINKADHKKKTPLFQAIENKQVEIVKYLISEGASTDTIDVTGNTALLVATQLGNLETVQLLLQIGANIHAADHRGNTVLHWAVERNDLDRVKILVTSGADINRGDNQGKTPLLRAIEKGHPQIVKYLISAGADRYIAAMAFSAWLS